MVVLSVLTIGGAIFYEYRFVSNATNVIGQIKSFKKKPFSAAQGDPIEMEVVFTIGGRKMKFYSSRTVVEQILGVYKVGDKIPVTYNPDIVPNAKIGNVQHLYQVTLIFMVVWAIFLAALAYVWRRTALVPSAKNDAANG